MCKKIETVDVFSELFIVKIFLAYKILEPI